MKALALTLLLLTLSVFAAIDSHAATLTVTKTADTNDRVCDDDCSLREAVFAAASGDTIVFSSLFESPQTISLTAGQITINGDLTFTGPGRSLLTVLGVLGETPLGRLFVTAPNTSISMSHMKLTNGCACYVGGPGGGADTDGGAIKSGGTLRLENMSFLYNRAYKRSPIFQYCCGYGGAIISSGGVTVINSEFIGNRSVDGGSAIYASSVDITDSQINLNTGGYAMTATSVTANNSTFYNNYSTYGGAILGSDVAVYDSDFNDNERAIYGSRNLHVENSSFIDMGAYPYDNLIEIGPQGIGVIKRSSIINNPRLSIWNKGTLYIIDSTVTGNGRGVETEGGNLFVTNSTVSGNNSTPFTYANGAGISINPDSSGNAAHVVVTNSTITNNKALGPGAGIYKSDSCTLTLRNSIVAINSSSTGGPDVRGVVVSEGNNLVGNTTGSSGWLAGDLLNIDPILGPLADNGGHTFTHALMGCSPAINAGNNALAIDPQTQLTLTGDQRGFSRFVGNVDIGAYEATGNACVTPTPTATATPTATPTNTPTATPTASPTPSLRTAFDYDADGRADISVFRPSTGAWYLQRSQAGPYATLFGVSTDKITPADFDGDGRTDIAVYRRETGIWYVFNSSNGTVSYDVFGLAEDLPTPADFDGDSRADVSVFRPSTGTWYRRNTSDGSFFAMQFGAGGDRPAVGDYDGDGEADIAVYRPSNGTWYWTNSSDDTFHGEQFGIAADVISPADYDGDGHTDLAVFRPSSGSWYIRHSTGGTFGAVKFGISEDIPAVGDFDGDRRADMCVFRPSTGTWYRTNSSDGSFHAYQFGTAGDLPTQSAFRY